MKRALAYAVPIFVALVAIIVYLDPLFWKRYALAAVHSPAHLPKSFYTPTETIEGNDAGEPPRVDPALEQLDAGALRAAADYAGRHRTTALIVARRGHIVFEQYWDGERFDAMADLGDFSASLAALTLGAAIGDRKIGLVTEPIANYIEELRGTEEGAITLRDLLQSSSGLSAPAGGFGPWSPAAHLRYGRDTRAQCLSRKLVARPGERWHPQMCDVELLATVIERATHERYARYIANHLWKPIGAADAQLAREDEAGAPRAACCLRARRGDWIRIAELLVSDGRFEGEQVLPPGWVREMLAPARSNKNFGYQVWLGQPFAGAAGGASEPYAADDVYLLKGTGKSRLWVVPSLGLSILRTGTNSETDPDWDDARIPNLVIRGARDFQPRAVPSGPPDIRSLVPNH
ncbi:MAG TPA: serine hydrolase [Steroidobacteraceae bacterium]|nr:serine hydrolase [Steroidobacteraceae bacterium]